MNKERRKVLEGLAKDLAELQGKIDDVKSQVETCRDEEQDYYDNMHENFQNGEKGERAQAAIDAMEECLSSLDETINNIETANEYLGSVE